MGCNVPGEKRVKGKSQLSASALWDSWSAFTGVGNTRNFRWEAGPNHSLGCLICIWASGEVWTSRVINHQHFDSNVALKYRSGSDSLGEEESLRTLRHTQMLGSPRRRLKRGSQEVGAARRRSPWHALKEESFKKGRWSSRSNVPDRHFYTHWIWPPEGWGWQIQFQGNSESEVDRKWVRNAKMELAIKETTDLPVNGERARLMRGWGKNLVSLRWEQHKQDFTVFWN